MMSQPFSYYGGKQRMASNIIPLLPPHTVYVEPFCGGATILFNKPIPHGNSDYCEVLNDTNDLVTNFYRVLRSSDGPELCRRLDLTRYSRAEYKMAKEWCKAMDKEPLDLAWAFFVNIFQSFAKKLNAGWGTSVICRNQAATWANKTDALPQFIERLKSVHIESLDAIEVIKKWDSPHTLFYCDPPYPETHQGHYGGYTQEDFNALIETLTNIESSCVLSCYDNPSVPSDWVKHEFRASSSARNSKQNTGEQRDRTECVWIKAASSDVRPELIKHMNALNRNDSVLTGQMSWLDLVESFCGVEQVAS